MSFKMTSSEATTTVPKCSRCHREGHSAQNCKVLPFFKATQKPITAAPLTCFRCKAPGHLARDCKVPASKLAEPADEDARSVVSTAASTIDGRNSGVCFLCGKAGHVRADCPFSKIRANPCTHCGGTDHGTAECKKMVCFECKKTGHKSGDCPQRAARLEKEHRAYEERQARRQAWLERQRQKKEDDDARSKVAKPAQAAPNLREESPPTPEVRPAPELKSQDLFPPLGGAAPKNKPTKAVSKSNFAELDE